MGRRWDADRYRRWVTAVVALGWLPTIVVGFTGAPDAEPFSTTVVYTLVTPIALHAVVVGLGWWLKAPFPNSAIGAMLLAPLGIAAAVAAEPAIWLPDAGPARLAVALTLVGLLAWGSGRWAAELVLEDTIDTM